MSTHSVRLLEHSVCQWHECQKCEDPRRFDDARSGVEWLKTFRHDDTAMRQMRQIAQQFDDDHSLLRATDDEVFERLGWLLHTDRLRVCGRNPLVYRDVALRRQRAIAEPPPRPVRRTVAEAPEPVEQETFTANADALAIAKVLIEAAKLGVPFCEECERAKKLAARSGQQAADPPAPKLSDRATAIAPPRPAPAPAPQNTSVPAGFPPTMDGDAAVQALLTAAKSGVPFCEECEKLAAAERAAG